MMGRARHGHVLGVALVAVACGRVTSHCEQGGHCASGTDDAGPKDASARDSGSADAIGSSTDGDSRPDPRLDGSLPEPLTDVCFAPIAPCGPLSPLVPSGAWQVWGVSVLRGGGGFAVSISQNETVGGVQYLRWRGVAVDKAGGCARPITAVISQGPGSYGLGPSATGADTVAGLVYCAYKFACGATLHRNGEQILDVNAGIAYMDADIYSVWNHDVSVTPDGLTLVVTGHRPDVALDQYNPPRLVERWVTTSVIASSDRPSSESLVGAATLSNGNIVLALTAAGDAGSAAGRVELQSPDFTELASWQAPANVVLKMVTTGQDRIAIAGEALVSGESRAWFAVLDGNTLATLWGTTLQDTTELPFEISFSQSGTLVVGLWSSTTGVHIRAYGPDGHQITWSAPSYSTSDAGIFWEADLGIAPDGDVMLAVDQSVTYCPGPG